MAIAIAGTKLVVRDVDAAERFYLSLGFKLITRIPDHGEGEGRQRQAWLSQTGDQSAPMLVVSRFIEHPDPSTPPYPGEAWLVFNVDDVDATIAAVEAGGGSVLIPAADAPDFGVRAACVADPEGHRIELVGPMPGAGAAA